MFSLPFEQGPIRPVDEADSLLIRTTRGCPWNRCSFCSLYDTMKFSIRPVTEIKQDIWAARDYFGGHPFDACFLQDGDSFVMRAKDLIEILETPKKAFPSLRQISSYGRAQTMVKKSSQAIKEICDAGLNKLYCGMESGSRKVLEKIRKGITPESIIRSARMARQAGMHTTQFIILGLGVTELSESRQANFIMGRRLGYYRTLDDQAREPDAGFIEKQGRKAPASGRGTLEDIFHDRRIQVI
ncbi:MAG: radical SAM protein [Desulfotignum sp.]